MEYVTKYFGSKFDTDSLGCQNLSKKTRIIFLSVPPINEAQIRELLRFLHWLLSICLFVMYDVSLKRERKAFNIIWLRDFFAIKSCTFSPERVYDEIIFLNTRRVQNWWTNVWSLMQWSIGANSSNKWGMSNIFRSMFRAMQRVEYWSHWPLEYNPKKAGLVECLLHVSVLEKNSKQLSSLSDF